MLNPDYKEMLSLLLDNEVEFLLVGAYALAAHGLPRATADIDIFVKPSRENAALLFRTLGEFGASMVISAGDMVHHGVLSQTQAIRKFCQQGPIQCVEPATGVPLFIVNQEKIAAGRMDVIQ